MYIIIFERKKQLSLRSIDRLRIKFKTDMLDRSVDVVLLFFKAVRRSFLYSGILNVWISRRTPEQILRARPYYIIKQLLLFRYCIPINRLRPFAITIGDDENHLVAFFPYW